MTVQLITSEHQLAALRPQWNQLAQGQPFRSWDWQVAWWRHYGTLQGRQLYTLAYFDGPKLVGLLPCYRRLTALGRVLRPLASGEVCSEYLGLLAEPGRESEVGHVLASTLSGRRRPIVSSGSSTGWDLLLLDAQDPADQALGVLSDELGRLGHPQQETVGTACWRLRFEEELQHPRGSQAYEEARFERYLLHVARGHRHRLRKADRHGRAQGYTLHLATDEDSLRHGFSILVDLHQRRRAHHGQTGMFARRRFLSFHQDATLALLRDGKLWLAWLQDGPKPIATYYCLAESGILHCYQSGLDPDHLDDEPGRILLLRLIRQALRQDFVAIDLLRGNEPYKSHLGAKAQPSVTLCVGNRTMLGRAAFALTQVQRQSRRLASQVLRHVRAP